MYIIDNMFHGRDQRACCNRNLIGLHYNYATISTVCTYLKRLVVNTLII